MGLVPCSLHGSEGGKHVKQKLKASSYQIEPFLV